MGRIVKAYEEKFRSVLRELGSRRVEQGVLLLMDHAACLSIRERVSPATGLTMVHRRLLVARSIFRRYRSLNDRQSSGRHGSLSESRDQNEPKDESRSPILFCDAGL